MRNRDQISLDEVPNPVVGSLDVHHCRLVLSTWIAIEGAHASGGI